jgi:hypothetical protein
MDDHQTQVLSSACRSCNKQRTAERECVPPVELEDDSDERRTCLDWFDSADLIGPWEDDEGNVWEQSALPGGYPGGAFPSLRATTPSRFSFSTSDVSSPSSSSKYPCESAESEEARLFSIPERKEPSSPPPEAMELQRPFDDPLTEKLKSINRTQRKDEFLKLLFGPQQQEGDSQISSSTSTSTRRISSGSGGASPNPHRQIGTPSKAPWSGLLGPQHGGVGDRSPSTTATATESPLTPSVIPPGPATIRKLSSASAPVSPGPGVFTRYPPGGILGRFSCCTRRSPVATSPVPSPVISSVKPGDEEPSVGLDALDRELIRSVSFQDDLLSKDDALSHTPVSGSSQSSHMDSDSRH